MKKINIDDIKAGDVGSIQLNAGSGLYDIVIGEQKVSLSREDALGVQKKLTEEAKNLVERAQTVAAFHDDMTKYLRSTRPLGI